MNKKFDLNTYLNKYANNTQVKKTQSQFSQNSEIDYFSSQRQSQKNINYYQPNDRNMYIQKQMSSTQSHVGFQKSQIECIQRLQFIKRSLMEQQKEINYFLANHFEKLNEDMLRQYNKLRDRLLQVFEKSFQQNKKKIDQERRIIESNQPKQFINIRKRITQINHHIEQLQQGLKGQNYRATIANVVTRDFQNDISQIRTIVNQIKKNLQDDIVIFRVDEYKVKVLQQNLSSIMKIELVKNDKLHQLKKNPSNFSTPSSSILNTHHNRDLIRGSVNLKK